MSIAFLNCAIYYAVITDAVRNDSVVGMRSRGREVVVMRKIVGTQIPPMAQILMERR